MCSAYVSQNLLGIAFGRPRNNISMKASLLCIIWYFDINRFNLCFGLSQFSSLGRQKLALTFFVQQIDISKQDRQLCFRHNRISWSFLYLLVCLVILPDYGRTLPLYRTAKQLGFRC